MGEDLDWGSDSNINSLTYIDEDATKAIQDCNEAFSYSDWEV